MLWGKEHSCKSEGEGEKKVRDLTAGSSLSATLLLQLMYFSVSH